MSACSRRRASQARAGLSLLEVLIALAIFVMSLTALQYMVSSSVNLSLEAQARNRALLLARSKMAEFQIGAITLQSQSGSSFEEAPEFSWSADVQPSVADGLYQVSVRITRTRPDGSKLEVPLHQMLLDPQKIGSTQDTPQSTGSNTAEGTMDPSGAGTTGSSSGVSGSGSSGTAGTASPPSSSSPTPAGRTPTPAGRTPTPAPSPSSSGGRPSSGKGG